MNDAEIPEARVYTHHDCSTETIVGGEAFQAISDPLSDMQRTWCESCMDYFPLSEFAWSDTGEKITDYYARHAAGASGLQRFLCSRVFLLISVAFGLLVGVVIAVIGFRDERWTILLLMIFTFAVIGVVLFGSLKEFVLGPFIVRRVCGVSDTRMLR